MATAYTSLLGLALPVTGELSGTWGSTVNTEITALLDSAVAGTTTLSTDADVTLTTTTGAANTSRQAILLCSGARTVLRTITAPAQSKIYTIINATTGGFSVKLVGAGPTTGVTIVAGESAVCAWNGSDFIKISNTAGVGTFTNLTVTGTLGVTGVATLGAGAILNTPASVTLTNATGLPVSTGISGLGTGVATFLATPSSANLAAALTDETGTGANVFATSPTLVTPILGTPTSATLTNATGLPISTGVSGLGTSVATALAVNVGTAGAVVVNGGVLGTPSSGTVTNLTGTASININGTVGATTASTGAFTTLTTSSTVTHNGGTANGVAYLNGSKVLTTGAALTFDGSQLNVSYADTAYNAGLRVTNTTNNSASQAKIYVVNDAGEYFSLGRNSTALGSQSALFATGNYPLEFYTNSTKQATLDASGNLGLGVTPSAWASGSTAIQNSAGSIWRFGADNIYFGQNYYFNGTNRIYSTTNNATEYQQGSGQHRWFNAPSGTAGNAITFTQAMTLDASGNLGIGTSSPAAVLHTSSGAVYNSIFATTRASGAFIQYALGASGATIGYVGSAGQLSSGTIADFAVRAESNLVFASGGGTERARIDSSGNLLVGTTSAGYSASGRGLIEINGSSALLGFKTGNTPRGYLYTQGTDMIAWAETGTFTIGTAGASPITFTTNNTERARIDSSGNLLVGTTSTIQGGKVSVASTTSGFTGTTSAGSGAGIGLDLQRTVANGDICYFRSTTGLAGYITITGANTCTYNQVSDVRLKKNIVDAPSALAKIESLQVRSFDWKDGSGAVPYGFIAQELNTVVPEAVSHGTTNEDGSMLTPWGIDTSLLVPYLVKAIQEQQTLITTLTARITALEGA